MAKRRQKPRQKKLPLPPKRKPKFPMERWSIEQPHDHIDFMKRIPVYEEKPPERE